MLRRTNILLCLVLSAIVASSVVHAGSEELMNHLFKRYDRRVRPAMVNDTAVSVQMSIVLGILIEMHENEQVVSFVISHTQRWYDTMLRWEPIEYNGMRELVVPRELLWQPKMFVYNSMDTKEMLTESRYDVRVRHDGLVKINIPQFVTCSCQLNVKFFPFDTQFCSIALASPLLNTGEMKAHAKPPPKDSYFSGNAEWDLENVTVRNLVYVEGGEERPEVHYVFQLRRRPVFYVTVVVIPISLITALSILGIFAPGSSGSPRNEKVSLGLGSLLAMTVLLGIIADSMPKSSSTSLLGFYILAVILQSALAVGVSMGLVTLRRRLITNGEYPTKSIYRIMRLQPEIFPRIRRKALEVTPSNGQMADTSPLLSNGYLARSTPRGSVRSAVVQTVVVANGTTRPSKSVSIARSDRNSVKSVKEHKNGFVSDDLSRIHLALCQLCESQRIIRKKFEQDQLKVLITKEWGRIFTRIDYACLLAFQALNLGTLLHFLQYAFADSPKMDLSSMDRVYVN